MKQDVIQNEQILNKSVKVFGEVRNAVEKLKSLLPQFQSLKNYYGSEEYMRDFDKSNLTSEYDDIHCGVLSEDGVYNLLVEAHELAVEMLELGTALVKG